VTPKLCRVERETAAVVIFSSHDDAGGGSIVGVMRKGDMAVIVGGVVLSSTMRMSYVRVISPHFGPGWVIESTANTDLVEIKCRTLKVVTIVVNVYDWVYLVRRRQ